MNYWWASNVLSEQIENSYDTMIKELKTSIDDQFTRLNDLSIQLYCTPWVNKIIHMQGSSFDYDRMDCVELNNHVLELKSINIINDFVENVSLFFPEQQFIVSSEGAEDAEIFFNNIHKVEEYNYLKWTTELQAIDKPTIIAQSKAYAAGHHEKVLTYAQVLPSIDQEGHTFLVTFLNKQSIIKKLKGYQMTEDSSIYIVDDEGNVLLSVGDDNDYLSNSITQTIKNKNEDDDGFININHKRYFIFRQPSDVIDWQYVILMPHDVVVEKVTRMKDVTMFLAALLSVIGLAVSYIFTAFNYNPLLDLVNVLKGRFSEKEVATKNEYDFLQKTIHLLLSKEDLLREEAERQAPFIRNAYLSQILHGNKVEISEELMESIHMQLPARYYMALLLVLDKVRGINSDFKQGIQQKVENQHTKIYFVELTGNKKVAIINMNDLNKSKALLLYLKELVELELDVKCIASVGKVYTSLYDLSKSYEEACKAVDYKLINDKSGMIFFDEIDRSNNSYYYPIDKELEIINGLRRGNASETMKVIGEVLEINVANNLTMHKGRYLFYNLIGTFIKVLNELDLNHIVTIDKKYIEEIEDLKDVHQYLVDICNKICHEIKHNKTNRHQILKLNMISYLDKHFDDPNLSLETLSDYLDKSLPYVSKFFKEQMGCNFLDYVNRKRMRKAKELLNGQMTIIEIATLIGYNNDTTFRRVFKKYENMTPSEYIMMKDKESMHHKRKG